MKQLDWKSFAIGMLLTTTVVFGIAATNPTTEKQWDENQKWLVKHLRVDPYPTKEDLTKRRTALEGWELVGGGVSGFTYRKPVVQWPELPPYKETRVRSSEIFGGKPSYDAKRDLNFFP